jgi:hypothetical protein
MNPKQWLGQDINAILALSEVKIKGNVTLHLDDLQSPWISRALPLHLHKFFLEKVYNERIFYIFFNMTTLLIDKVKNVNGISGVIVYHVSLGLLL